MAHNLFDTFQDFKVGAGAGKLYSLPALEKAGIGKISRLPVSIRIVLESVLRNCDGKKVTEEHVRELAAWAPTAPRTAEIPFVVARVVLQDFTGVPLLCDLAAMRNVAKDLITGADWFAGLGTEKSKGYGIFSLSGHVKTPGQYEAPLGITLRELIDLAGGMPPAHPLKFWTPGGSSTPLLTHEHLDVPLDFEGVAAAGSMLGTRALQIFDDTTCVLRAALRWTEFYQHESCGKCTPCREGSYWMVRTLQRLENGEGTDADLETILDVGSNIIGRAFCALGDAVPVADHLGHPVFP